jgi:hypothetical protein
MPETVTPPVGAIAAADHYRRAEQLFHQAAEQLVRECKADRDLINLRAIASRAGVHNRKLERWLQKGAFSNGGE